MDGLLQPYKDMFSGLFMCSLDSSLAFCTPGFFFSLVMQMLPLWLLIWFGWWLWKKL